MNKKQKCIRSLELKCDKLTTTIVLHIDQGRCGLCDSSWRVSPHHIIKRRFKLSRHDPNFVILLCAHCHEQAERSHEDFLFRLKRKHHRMYAYHEANHFEIQRHCMLDYEDHLKAKLDELKRLELQAMFDEKSARKKFRRTN